MIFSKKTLLYGLLIIAITACKDTPLNPTVKIEDFRIDGNTVSCNIIPLNATGCAYSYYKNEEELPSAQQLLKDGIGIRINSETETKIEINDLEYGMDYVLIVAVENHSERYNIATKHFSIDEMHNATDLGKGANCYIVSEQGSYTFTPLHVSGEPVANIASVNWVWASKVSGSDNQALIDNIQYDNGKISFSATGEKGNALLAAFDKKGNIVWSWHIWCTDMPQTHIHDNGSVFQDRWLGATDNTPDAVGSFGLLYQWGRKDPFFGGTDANDCEDYGENPFSIATQNTVMNPEVNLKWQSIPEAVDIERSISEPTTHFALSTLDWLSVQNDRLWDVTKTDYDPCPAGYRVPTSDELSDLQSITNGNYDIERGGFNLIQNGNTIWWQGCGNRDYKGYLTILGQTFIWSSDTEIYPDAHFSYRYILNNDWGCYVGIGNRSFAQSIRCVAE